MRRAAILLLLAGLVAGVAACGGGATAGPDVTGEWQLTEGTVDGATLPQPPGLPATLAFDDGELRGRSFCNHLFASYRLDGASIRWDGLGGTEMGCDPAVMAAETAFVAALERVTTVATEGADLVLTGEAVRLRFRPVPPPADRPLAGTRWVLDTLVDGGSASSTVGDPAVLVLRDDRTVEASTGCQQVSGTWLLEGDALVVDDLLGSAICPPELAGQDAHVTAVLGGGPTPVVDGDRLTLTADDGRGLVYRADG